MTAPTAEANTAPAADDTASDTDAQVAADTAAADAAEEEAKPKKRGRKPSTAQKTRAVELTLTVTGTLDGEWQADLLHGNTRVVQGMPVPALAVSAAAKELHPTIAEAIESVISTAREQHEQRLAELEAELNKVKQALAGLDTGQ
jgi:Family of unknown function (DUF6319)